MQKILVSACLLGEKVRYDGGHSRVAALEQWWKQGRIIAICPEVAGGLPTPRPAAEIESGDSDPVLRGRGFIRRIDGQDVTDAFIDGAERVLALCFEHHIRIAVLKEGSPSCGVNLVNNGNFSGTKISGMGITARLLSQHGVFVFSENHLDRAAAKLTCLEEDSRNPG
jgi:uncharacterized protein YbbK (DUF523 family)